VYVLAALKSKGVNYFEKKIAVI